MAFVRYEYCRECGKETQHINGKCVHCEHQKALAEEAAWNAHDVDWKLNDLRKRLEKLEQGSIRY